MTNEASPNDLSDTALSSLTSTRHQEELVPSGGSVVDAPCQPPALSSLIDGSNDDDHKVNQGDSRGDSPLMNDDTFPIHCCFESEKCLFRVIQSRGKTLSSGGFGVLLDDTTGVGGDDAGGCSSSDSSGENYPSPQRVTSFCSSKESRDRCQELPVGNNHDTPRAPSETAAASSKINTNRNMAKGPTEYLFVEEVLFLYERGLLAVWDDNGNNNNNKKDTTSNLTPPKLLSNSKYAMYELLNRCRCPLPTYLLYAYLRTQMFRVVRHTRQRRCILEEIGHVQQTLHQQQQQQMTSTEMKAVSSTRDHDCNPAQTNAMDSTGISATEHRYDNTGTSNNYSLQPVRVDETKVAEALKNTRLQLEMLKRKLRRDAAEASPPLLDSNSIAFDVYHPRSNFPRSLPGLPDIYVTGTWYTEGCGRLNFRDIQSLLRMAQGTTLRIAAVSDAGAIVMLGVTDYGVPAITDRKEESNA